MDLVANKNNTERPARPGNSLQSPVGLVSPPVRKASGGRKKVIAVVIFVVVALLAGGGWLFYNKSQQADSVAVEKDVYQAVFLTNGQVYFGKLQIVGDNYLTLKNIYYLQVQQPVQPADTTANASKNQTQLVKLGNELHGPKDSMQISSKQVLFWENLKTDGKVSQAIASYKP